MRLYYDDAAYNYLLSYLSTDSSHLINQQNINYIQDSYTNIKYSDITNYNLKNNKTELYYYRNRGKYDGARSIIFPASLFRS